MAAHDAGLLRSLLSERHLAGRMSLHQKKLFLEHLKARGSLEYTRQAVGELQNELKRMAERMGMLDNEKLKDLLKVLMV
jgi:fusicocca-2,10(14)-diene synthase/ophiobolin F synthase